MSDYNHADLVLKNGVIYTADAVESKAEAVAVKNGLIQAVGSNEIINKHVGPNTRVINLKDRMVLPGMIDSHLHPPGIAIYELYSINLSWIASKDKLLEDIADFVRNNPNLEAYYGRGWAVSVFEGEERKLGPGKESLDQVCPDAPVALKSYDGHSMWVNSKALDLVGITDTTPDPEGGSIVRDPSTGEAWGTLKGSACNMLPPQDFTPEQLREGLKAFQSFMHSLGYTGIFSAGWDHDLYEAFSTMEADNELKLWVRDSKRIDIRKDESLQDQLEQLFNLNRTYRSELYSVTAAKIFIDGVVESGTARLIEPYTEALGKGSDYRGTYYWEDMDALKDTIVQVNQAEIQVHFHSIGDQATRDALDALEEALKIAPGEHRNAITHLQLVSPQDLPRFKELGVIANVQPYWHIKEPGWWHEVDYAFLGERAEKEYPLRSLLINGAIIASSSDYPVVDIPNPLWAIQAGVTRNLYQADYFETEPVIDQDDQKWLLNREERISLNEMIKSFTVNNAYALFIEESTGSIEPGKYADLVVLSENLFQLDPVNIDRAKVCQTIFHGEVVYDAEDEKGSAR